MERDAMTGSRLICWSAGGLPGLDVHAGVWMALEDQKIFPTACAGTSAGSIVAAMGAARSNAALFAAKLRTLRDCDVREERPLWKLRALCIDSFLRQERPLALIRDLVPLRFEDCAMPLSVFATNEQKHRSEELTTGLLRLSILASMSIPGVLPPVTIGAETYSDGATKAYVPLPVRAPNYDEVWIVVARPPINYPSEGSIVARLMRALHEMVEDQIQDTIAYAHTVCRRVVVVRPPCGGSAPSLRFRHSLIAESYQWTMDHWNQILRGIA